MQRKPRHRPVLFHAGVSLALALAVAVACWLRFSGRWAALPWLAAWLVAVNPVAFGYYGFDKLQARRGGRRVPERVLFGLALVGGSLGAYAGMELFRHKTIKGSFRLVFWLIVALQLGLAAWIGWELGKIA